MEKSKTRLPTPLGNPAYRAGFPLSHRRDYGGWLNSKTGQFTCYEMRTSSFAKNKRQLWQSRRGDATNESLRGIRRGCHNGAMTRRRSLVLGIAFLFLFRTAGAQQYDLAIRNGHIIDGTGSPWYGADIGIKDGHIVKIGKIDSTSAAKTIDAHGLTVAPGFIDMLGQSELTILVDPHLPSKIFQGITTEITGEGNSIAPTNDRLLAEDKAGFDHYQIKPDWRSFNDYFNRLEKQGIGINLASYVGATTVRRMVIGNENRPPTAEELAQMQKLVLDAMHQGAMGVSTALQYAPAPYASTEELIALASTAASAGGIYATHMRSEGDGVLASLDETFRIAREAKIPVEIWHLKAAGKANWGKMPEIVAPHRRGSRLRAGYCGGHVRLYGVVQLLLSFCSAVGARWGRFCDGGANRRSGPAGANSRLDAALTLTGTTSGWKLQGLKESRLQ